MRLNNRQRNAIAQIVGVGLVQSVGAGPDETRGRSFLENAIAVAEDLPRVVNNVTRHDLAYSVVHDVGEALLAAHGYRARSEEGAHQSVVVFLTAVFDKPPAREAALRADLARERRNSRYYRAHTPSAAEADQLVADAQVLLEAARSEFE